MAKQRADGVLETSITTGTGSYALLGGVAGYRAMSAIPGIADGDTLEVYVEGVDGSGVPDGSGYEHGVYTWRTGNTLERTSIKSSSNGGAAVSWASGTRRIGLTLLASEYNPGVPVGVVGGLAQTTNNPTLGDMTFQRVGVSVAYSPTIHAPQVSLPDLWCNYGTPKTATDTGGTAAYTQIVTDNAGKAVAAASGSLAATVDDGANWLTLAGNWNSADANGSECVAVGDNGLVARSTTGAAGSWNITQPINKTTSWKRVRWVASLTLWVAVGVNSVVNGSVIMTSPTGVTWTSRLTIGTTARGFNDFKFDNAICVAAGVNDALYTSPNATAWTSRTVSGSGTHSWAKVEFSGTIWILIAVAAVSSLNIATSTDPVVAWTKRLATNSTTATVNCVKIFNSLIVLGTSENSANAIRTSPTNDGTTWTSQTAGANNVVALESDGTTLVGAGAGVNSGCSTPDGTTWTARTITVGGSSAITIRLLNGKLIEVSAYTGSGNNLAEITGGTTPTVASRFAGIVLGATGAGAALRDAVYFNSTYIAFGDGLSITGSADAATWAPQNWVPTSAPASSVYGAGTFVIGLATGWVLVSTDAKQWIHKNTGAASGPVKLAFANSLFVAATNAASATNLATSADALTWAVKTLPVALALIGPAVYGASLWAVANGNNVYTTTDFATFTSRTGQPGGSIHFLCFAAGWFVCIGDVGGLSSSADGLTWGNRGTLFGVHYSNTFATDGARIVICAGGAFVYSDNGVNWYAGALHQFASSYVFPIYVNGKFVVGQGAAGAFYCDFFFGANSEAMAGGQCSSASPTTAVVVTAIGAGNGKIYIAQSVAGSIAVIPDTLSEPSSIYINGSANTGRLNNYGRVR